MLLFFSIMLIFYYYILSLLFYSLFVIFCVLVSGVFFFFFKQKTAYEMRIRDWSSDVCSSDLRAARGRDKGEIVRYAGLVERRDRIAAARDRDQRSFARQRRGGPGERDGRSVEGRRLERAERAVPYQSAAILVHVGQRLDRRRTHVEDHLVGGDLMDVDRPRRRVGRKLLRDHHVIGQRDGAAGGVGAVEDRVGGIDQIMFAQRFSDIDPTRGEEGVGHAAADNQVIDPPDQVGQPVDLARQLGAAAHRRHRLGLGRPACRAR